MSRISSRALAGALAAVVTLGGAIASCKWSVGTPAPRPPPAPTPGTLRATAARPPVGVAVTAAGDAVTLRVEGRPAFAGPPTVELGPRGAVGQPLALASAGGGAYEGTRRGLPPDGILTGAVFGRDTAGREVRAYFQLAVAPVDPTADGQVSSANGELEVQLAPRTLPDGARVIIAPAPEPAPAAGPRGRVVSGPFAVSTSDGAALAQPVRLAFHVPQHFDVAAFDPTSFTISRWDGAAWRPLGGALVDSPHDELVLLPVDSLGSFVLTAQER